MTLHLRPGAALPPALRPLPQRWHKLACTRAAALLCGLCAILTNPTQAQTTAQATPPVAASDLPPAPIRSQPAAQQDWSAQINTFASALAADIPAEWAGHVLGQARHNARVKRLMTPAQKRNSPTVRDWRAYRQRLITAARIEAGLQFWQRHERTLRDVQARTGVPAHVIVGIIGIETTYGQNTGSIRVLDALATLAFDYPQQHPRALERAQFFRKELEQFLRLCLANGLDPLNATGSFAGALGIPQFMPSSWLLYGADGDGDQRVNLIDSPEDAIASVANYLLAHGWKSQQPAYFEIALNASAEQMAQLLAPDILPTFDAAALRALGVQLLPEGQQYFGQMALIELQNGNRPAHYVAGTENFYAVTRYNQSSYYALAVLQLGEAVLQQRTQRQDDDTMAP